MSLKTYNCILDVIHAFYRVAFVMRFSIAMTLLAGIAIRFADQSLEALRVLAASDSEQYWPRIFFVVSTLILSLLSWYCARVLLYLIDPLPNAEGCAARAREFWMRHLPRIVGALPLLFIAWALWAAADSKAVENNYGLLKVLAAINLLAAFVLYTFFHLRRWLIAKLTGRKVKNIIPGITHLAKSGKVVLLLTISFWVFLLVLFTMESGRHKAVQAATFFGPLAIVLLFAAIWTPVGSALVYAAKLTRLPLFLILLILAFSFSAADWNDNHAVRSRPNKDQTQPMDIHEGFKQWLQGRCDMGNYKEENGKSYYPVFIVSAEGGGLRAGYFASLVLSKLQDADPAFAHHVFAISGVSGGSLGGAVFAALAKRYITHDAAQPCNFQVNLPDKAPEEKDEPEGKMHRMTDRILGHDILSPILGSLLFPDLLQRFLPVPFERFDRSRAAEDALTYYWKRATGGNEFDKDFYFSDLYKSDFATQSTPALFFNTTRVETGEQLVVSSLNPKALSGSNTARNIYLNGLTSLADLDPAESFSLVTSAYLSARFPVVASAGYVRVKGEKVRFVDGGYFENSGTATVLDLLSALNIKEIAGNIEGSAGTKGVNIRLIVIRIGTDFPSDLQCNETENTSGPCELQYRWHGLGEITSPVFAVVNAGTARGTLSVREMETALKQLNNEAPKGEGQAAGVAESTPTIQVVPTSPASGSSLLSTDEAHFQINQGDIKLPLGYLLSKAARVNMSGQIDAGPNHDSFTKVIEALKRKQ